MYHTAGYFSCLKSGCKHGWKGIGKNLNSIYFGWFQKCETKKYSMHCNVPEIILKF